MMQEVPFTLFELSGVQTSASPGLAGWLAEQRVSLALTLPEANTLMLLGVMGDGALSVRQSYAERAGALGAQGASTLYLSTRYQVWRLEHALAREQRHHDGSDQLYLPQAGYTTGNLQIKDMAVDDDGAVLFASSLYSCIAAPSRRDNFVPRWRPPFISELRPEDRCHLSGLALREGQLAYVTAAGAGDEPDGWQAARREGGVVLDVAAGTVLADGLSLPHAPRLHRGELWLANSGAGELARVDLATGQLQPLCALPGYARALALHGDFAVVGLSNPREEEVYVGLPLFERLRSAASSAYCGLAVVDIRSGDIAHWLRVEGTQVRELGSVAILPGVRRPLAIPAHGEAAQNLVTVGPYEPLEQAAARFVLEPTWRQGGHSEQLRRPGAKNQEPGARN